MPAIHVCSAATMLPRIERFRVAWLVSITVPSELPETPKAIAPHQHLKLACHDIHEPTPGAIAPSETHVHALVDFAHRWHDVSDLVVHCSAGVSRSSAAALTLATALMPERIDLFTQRLREALPHAEPNRRLIQLADEVLGLDCRLIKAVENIGKGQLADPAPPGSFSLDDSPLE